MQSIHHLRSSAWLAERLGISVATVERLRMHNPSELPPHITIGRSIRYDDSVTEQWLRARQYVPAAPTDLAHQAHQAHQAQGDDHDE